MKLALLLISILISPIISYGQNFSLENEEVIIKFKTSNGKWLELSKDKLDKYLIYRFGKNDTIELEFPKEKNNSWNKFTISSYRRGGGIQNEGMDLKYLYFKIKNYKYVIYEEYIALKGKTEYGIKVINLISNKEIDIKADPDSVKGSLSNLIENLKVKNGEELFR